MNERAVSEAIGFILILGIVISGIGLVTLYGYPVLLKEQSNTDVKNMERAMIVIQNDMKSLCFKNVPYKETSLQVSGGTLEVVNSTSYGSSINISNSTDFWDYSLGALIYRSDRGNEVISLENGAVMTRQEGSAGSAMLAEPRWFYDDSTGTFVVYIMNITTETLMAKSGMTTVRMSLENATTHPPLLNPTAITVKYETDPSGDYYSTAWENYLTGSSLGMDKTAIPNEYKWKITDNPVNKLVIKEYEIKIHDI
ncbi:DUF7289 family protein [Methanoculleus nereidis]|jgi:hypothetical protein|nr:hypothetical protein [Methanoculleus sp. YWC-01]